MTTPDLKKIGESISEVCAPQKYKCPHCEKTMYFTQVAIVPKETRLTMKLESSTGAFSAHTVGHVIANFDKLLKMVAKDVGGKVHVFVDSVERTKKSLAVEFLITAVRNGKQKKHSTKQ